MNPCCESFYSIKRNVNYHFSQEFLWKKNFLKNGQHGYKNVISTIQDFQESILTNLLIRAAPIPLLDPILTFPFANLTEIHDLLTNNFALVLAIYIIPRPEQYQIGIIFNYVLPIVVNLGVSSTIFGVFCYSCWLHLYSILYSFSEGAVINYSFYCSKC